jgi:molecular chaperone Hsp33
MDFIERGVSDRYGLRFIFVDVTKTAEDLARRHGSDPMAAEVLARALAAVALLSSDLENEGECISIQLSVNGPVQGLLVEAAYGGSLRGYTYRKTLAGLDEHQGAGLSGVMGTKGVMMVLHSKPGNLLYSGHVPATPPDLQQNLARYYNMSRQVSTGVSLFTSNGDNGINRASGFIVQKLPHADTEKFVEVLERFNEGRIRDWQEDAGGLLGAAQPLSLSDLAIVARIPLSFGCRCSYEKILDVLQALPESDIREMAESPEIQAVTCHFCGRVYTVSRTELGRIRAARDTS